MGLKLFDMTKINNKKHECNKCETEKFWLKNNKTKRAKQYKTW